MAMLRWTRPLYLMAKPPSTKLPELRGLYAMFGIESSYPLGNVHSTLLPLGESTPDKIEATQRALCDFDAAPFALIFDHIEGSTLKPRKGQRSPGNFQRTLAHRLAAFGIPLPDYAFSAHLNLSYDDKSARRAAIPPFSWIVDEIMLVESVKGHLDRGRWRLATRQLALDL